MINRALSLRKCRSLLRRLGTHTEQRYMLLTLWGTPWMFSAILPIKHRSFP
jgi:hypothetical protein